MGRLARLQGLPVAQGNLTMFLVEFFFGAAAMLAVAVCLRRAHVVESECDRLRAVLEKRGAPDGNRTHVSSLGSWRSTIELQAHPDRRE